MQLRDKKLVVQEASVGAKMGELGLMESLLPTPVMPMNINIPGPQIEGTAQAVTVVLCLMNMVTKEELEDDKEYEGVCVCMSTCVYVQECMRRRRSV